MKLNQSLTQSLNQKDCNDVSLYIDKPADKITMMQEVKKLIAAFPEMTSDFIILLVDRLTENNFTEQRVKDAINNIIDTNPYKRPAIADIISFDRKVKTYSYNEMVAMCNQYRTSEDFKIVELGGKKRWIEK